MKDFADYAAELGFDLEEVRKRPEGHRAFVACQLLDLVRRDQKLARAERKLKSKTIRKNTPRSAREPCLVCKKNRLLTQRHHVKPVAGSDPDDPLAIDIVWLCPNCHTIAHMYMRGHTASNEFCDLLPLDQWRIVFDLDKRSRE